jgi:hypothetical protein
MLIVNKQRADDEQSTVIIEGCGCGRFDQSLYLWQSMDMLFMHAPPHRLLELHRACSVGRELLQCVRDLYLRLCMLHPV